FMDEAFTKNQLEYCLKSPDFVTLVATMDGEIVGFICGAIEFFNNEVVGHIYTLDVKQKYRKKGVGSKLIETLESTLAERGVTTVYLEVRVDNFPARRLYHKHGYKSLRRIRGYYEPNVDAVMCKKTLQT
ncbi:MAG: ribosomal protein S18-alanine N-acetyltransferase, partial [Thermoplasmata archaeon]